MLNVNDFEITYRFITTWPKNNNASTQKVRCCTSVPPEPHFSGQNLKTSNSVYEYVHNKTLFGLSTKTRYCFKTCPALFPTSRKNVFHRFPPSHRLVFRFTVCTGYGERIIINTDVLNKVIKYKINKIQNKFRSLRITEWWWEDISTV